MRVCRRAGRRLNGIPRQRASTVTLLHSRPTRRDVPGTIEAMLPMASVEHEALRDQLASATKRRLESLAANAEPPLHVGPPAFEAPSASTLRVGVSG